MNMLFKCLGVTLLLYPFTAHSMRFIKSIEISPSGPGRLYITIKNQTESALCLRSGDFEYDQRGDFVFFHPNSNTAKFRGEKDKFHNRFRGAFFRFDILLPNAGFSYGFEFDRAYKFKGEKVRLAVAVPAIPCEIATKKSLKLPELERLKSSINLSQLDISGLESGSFPEWEADGLLLYSDYVEIKNN